MQKKLQKLLSYFESEKVSFADDRVSEFQDGSEPRLILEELMPERVCSYDTETIDDIGCYGPIIRDHMLATLGEWSANDVEVSEKDSSTVTVEFAHNGKDVTWSFEHDSGDYVSDAFYKKMNAWVSRNLKGKFVSLPTYGQDVAFAYLPKQSAKKLDSFIGNTVTANAFVQHFRSDNELPTAYRELRFDRDFDINCHDDTGETALTAAIKAKKVNQAMLALDEAVEVDPWTKNEAGQSPLQLSRKMGLQEITERLEPFYKRENREWSDLEKETDSESMLALIRALKEHPKSNTMYPSTIWWSKDIDFGKQESFEVGHDSLTIGRYFKPGIYEEHGSYNLQYRASTGDGYSMENIELAQTIELIEAFYE